MRKNVLFTLFLSIALLTAYHSKAQYYHQEKNLSLGLQFNPNIGWLSYGDDDQYRAESKVGFSYGLLADIGFNRNYYFSTGLFINSLQSRVENHTNLTSGITQKVYRLQYAEVPLAIKLKTNEGRSGRFYGQFGFTAGVKVSGKEKLENNPEGTRFRPISGDDIFRLGLLVGAGGEWRLTNSLSAVTGLSYNNGFTRTMKEGSPKLSYVSFNLGLLF